MAIYHLSMKTISRSAGRSATAAAAYRAAAEITDTRTGEVHDYRRRSGVEDAALLLPYNAPGWATDRAALWNQAEASERRSNSVVAREIVLALPDELDAEARAALVHGFARELVERHQCAVDVALHTPGKQGDQRNHHAHLLMTTRRLEPEGFSAKTRELDDRKTGRQEVKHWRERWADLTNNALERAGSLERVDHRTLAAQGIERTPTTHRGPGATALERKTRAPSRRQQDHQAETEAQRTAQRELIELDAQASAIETKVVALEATRSRRELQRMADQLANHKTPPGQAEATRTAVVRSMAKQRQARGTSLRERLANAWRRLEARRQAWMEAAPGRLRRLLGGREALETHEGQGTALERRGRDLTRREAIVKRETHPQRAQDWAQARFERDYPELSDRAEAERQERSKERQRKAAERQRSRERGRSREGWER